MKVSSVILGAQKSIAMQFGKKSLYAVADQFFFAGASFLSSVLLGRWLSPSDFGLFSLLQSIVWLIGAYYTALMIDPMMVFGPGKYSQQFTQYFSIIEKYHRKIATVLFIITFAVGVIFLLIGNHSTSYAIFGLAFSIPPTYLLWLFRRRFYSISKPRYAAMGSAGYFLLLLGFLSILSLVGITNVFSVYIAFSLSAVLITCIYRKKFTANSQPDDLLEKNVISNHWTYGKWALATVIFSWIPTNIFYTLISIFSSIENVAFFKAILNLVLPIMQVISSLAMLTIPDFVTYYRKQDLDGMKKRSRKFNTLFFILVLVYGLLLVLFGKPILTFLYDGKYLPHNIIVLVLSLIPFPAAFISVTSNVIRAAEKPKYLLFVYLFASLFSILFGILLINHMGLLGAVIAMLLTEIVTAVGMAIFIKRI